VNEFARRIFAVFPFTKFAFTDSAFKPFHITWLRVFYHASVIESYKISKIHGDYSELLMIDRSADAGRLYSGRIWWIRGENSDEKRSNPKTKVFTNNGRGIVPIGGSLPCQGHDIVRCSRKPFARNQHQQTEQNP
jgi:hypothetical protein